MTESEYDLETPRVLWAGTATIAAAVAAVLALREVAGRVIHPVRAFEPLTTPAPAIVDTVLCTAVAIFVFINVASYPHPVRTWNRVAAAVLILSFIPDILLAISHSMGGGWPEACALMAMHVAVWAICVTLLPWLAFTRQPRPSEERARPLSIL